MDEFADILHSFHGLDRSDLELLRDNIEKRLGKGRFVRPRFKLLRASEVTMRSPEWLDTPMGTGWIPKTGLTVVAGMQGLGKSTLSLAVAAHTSQTKPVLLFSAEDEPETTLVPRLKAHDANLENCLIRPLTAEFELPLDLEVLAAFVEKHEAALVVFDPIIAFVSTQLNSWKDQDVRVVLRDLNGLSSELGFALLGVMHPKKGEESEALHKLVGGSVAWTAAPRSVLGVARLDPEQPELLTLLHVKCNIGRLQTSRNLRVQDMVVDPGRVKTSRVVLEGDSKASLADLFKKQAKPSPAVEQARAFLLANVPEQGIDVKELQAMAEAHGISWASVKRARAEMPEIQVDSVDGNYRNGSIWRTASGPEF